MFANIRSAYLICRRLTLPLSASVVLLVLVSLIRPSDFLVYSTNPTSLITNLQTYRASSIPSADVVMIGDSSARFGLDSTILSKEILGCRFESLATNGYMTPTGYSDLLTLYAARHGRPPVVWLAMNYTALILTEALVVRVAQEATVRAVTEADFLRQNRDFVFSLLSQHLIAWPVEGSKEFFTSDLIDALSRGRGTHANPNKSSFTRDMPQDPGLKFTITPAIERRLANLGNVIRQINPRLVLITLTPNPQHFVSEATVETRATVLSKIGELLNIEDARILDTPAWLPSDLFNDMSHLTADGRVEYSRVVANALKNSSLPCG